MVKVLVCGGRSFNDVEFEVDKLMEFHDGLGGISTIIAGGATGADEIAEGWAAEMGIPCMSFPADWNKLGHAAGFIRNKEMLETGQPDLVMAFPGGPGTAHMVDISRKAKVELWESKMVLFQKAHPRTWFLSNFAEGFEFVDRDGVIWPSSEHYYQAQKSVDEEVRSKILNAKDPSEAKRMGQKKHGLIQVRPDWDPQGSPYGGYKEIAMAEALAYKFAPTSAAAGLLLGTGDDYLVEYAPWGDSYWGINRENVGLNRLGKMLMAWREQLRAKP